MTPERERYFERLGIAVGAGIPLFPEEQETIMAASQQLQIDPKDPKAKLQGVAKILGVDATDGESIRAALEALLSTVEGEPDALSARELAMCTERKLDPQKYAATRAAIRARSAT
jgi:hypothetical protein